jgi:hypothetical protein
LAIAKQAAATATEIPHPKSSRSISSDNTRAMNVIAALFPKHFHRVTDIKQGHME